METYAKWAERTHQKELLFLQWALVSVWMDSMVIGGGFECNSLLSSLTSEIPKFMVTVE